MFISFDSFCVQTGVSCLIATAIEILDNDRFVTVISLFDVDGNITTNTTHSVVTTIDRSEDSTDDIQRYITLDVCLV